MSKRSYYCPVSRIIIRRTIIACFVTGLMLSFLIAAEVVSWEVHLVRFVISFLNAKTSFYVLQAAYSIMTVSFRGLERCISMDHIVAQTARGGRAAVIECL